MGVYSVQDYVVYITILFFILWFLMRFLFSRIEIDRKFLIAIAPYVLMGVAIRVLADTGFFPRSQFWSITPGVYVLCVIMAGICIIAGRFLESVFKGRIPYWGFPFAVGSIISIFLILKISEYLVHPMRMMYPVMIALSITLIVYLISITIKSDFRIFRRFDNLSIIFAHLLDGSATFIAYNYFNFSEEHLVPIYLISLAGDNAIIMIPAKLIIILIVLYVIEKYREEEVNSWKNSLETSKKNSDNNSSENSQENSQKNSDNNSLENSDRDSKKNMDKNSYAIYAGFKILIFILGMGPGLRNMILPALSL